MTPTRKATRRKVTPRAKRQAKPRALTLKQRRFIDGYLRHGNATQAALDAGYSAKAAGEQGHENLKNPKIAAALTAERAATAERNRVTADEVIQVFRENIDRAREYPDSPKWGAVANMAATSLGKTIGLFLERRELTGRDGAPLLALEAIRAAVLDAGDS